MVGMVGTVGVACKVGSIPPNVDSDPPRSTIQNLAFSWGGFAGKVAPTCV